MELAKATESGLIEENSVPLMIEGYERVGTARRFFHPRS